MMTAKDKLKTWDWNFNTCSKTANASALYVQQNRKTGRFRKGIDFSIIDAYLTECFRTKKKTTSSQKVLRVNV
jgi:hypothetical protein